MNDEILLPSICNMVMKIVYHFNDHREQLGMNMYIENFKEQTKGYEAIPYYTNLTINNIKIDAKYEHGKVVKLFSTKISSPDIIYTKDNGIQIDALFNLFEIKDLSNFKLLHARLQQWAINTL